MKDETEALWPDCNEGPDAFHRFDAVVGKLLSVPHSVIAAREKAYKEQSLNNPNRRGPKPKAKKRRVRRSALRRGEK